MTTSWAAFEDLVRGRRSVKTYDPRHALDDPTLARLFELVTLSPSSFNLQHWRFVVARNPVRKAALQAAAFGQPQVGIASAVVLVFGKLGAFRDVETIYADAPAEIRERMSTTIAGFYAENETMQRDEAVRSGAIAATTLMFAAHALGLATGPMIGFDPAQVSEVVGAPADCVPVMMLVLGKQTGTPRPRAFRWPLAEVVRLEHFGGPGLGAG